MTAVKKYGVKDFIASGVHEHYITVDTVQLRHTGDTVTIGVRPQVNAEVASIKIRVTKRVQKHTEGVAGTASDKTDSETVVIDTAKDYQSTVKEQYYESGGVGAGIIVGGTYVDNVDVTISLMEVNLSAPDKSGSTRGLIGQSQVTAVGVPWDAIVTAAAWIVGVVVAAGCVYMLYRVWRWKKHGEALIPGWGK